MQLRETIANTTTGSLIVNDNGVTRLELTLPSEPQDNDTAVLEIKNSDSHELLESHRYTQFQLRRDFSVAEIDTIAATHGLPADG